jgi:hypothetical protein
VNTSTCRASSATWTASHHLDDRVLDLRRDLELLAPRNRGRGIPLVGGRLRVELRRLVRPDLRLVAEREVEGGRARFDERSARREAPACIGSVDDGKGPSRVGLSGALRTDHARLVCGAARHVQAAFRHLEAVAFRSTPGAQMHGELRCAPDHLERAAGRQRAQGASNQQVRAAIEPELLQIDAHRPAQPSIFQKPSSAPKVSTADASAP